MFGNDKLLREGTEAKALVVEKKIGSVASEAGRDGLKAVVSFGQAGDWANAGDALSCTYTLRVRFEDGSTAEISRHVRGVGVCWVPVGDLLPVRYDPTDRSKIEIDEPALREQRRAQASKAQADAIARGERELAGAQSAEMEQAEDFRKDAAAFREQAAAFAARTAHSAPDIGALEAIVQAKAAGDQAEVDRLKAEFMRSKAPGSPGVSAPGGASEASDPVERLQKLAELHEQGALSDSEFAAAKAKVLGGS